MTLPYVLTLVAARDATMLSRESIDEARALVSGAAPVILSDGEAADIPCPPLPDPVSGAFSGAERTLPRIRERFAARHVDVLLTRARGRRKGLLVADMDSTIVTGETLDELAARAGVGDRVAAITARSMNGEVPFDRALRERVALLDGLDEAELELTWRDTALTSGARTLVATMRAHNARTALVSGGFSFFTGRVAAVCGFDTHHANRLEIRDGRLTGRIEEPVLDRAAKLETLRALAADRRLQMSATLAVGDGANDLDMLGAAGLGIAFRAKPVVAAAAANRVDHADLRALLFAQGYRAADFRE